MNKIEMSKNPDYCFAALKLIEQLYKDGKVRILCTEIY